MATIKNFNLIEGISNQLKLQRFFEKLPEELGRTIVPVFMVNEVGQQRTRIMPTVAPPQTFLIPTGKRWEIESIFFTYVSTATVGNRLITVEYLDENGVTIFGQRADNVHVASLTSQYHWSPYAGSMDSASGTENVMTIPRHLPSGWTVRIRERNTVDVSDTILGAVNYREYQSAEVGQ